MELLQLYFFFAVTVGLWACYELLIPALYKVKNRETDVLYQNKILAYIAMFCISTLAAPLVVVIILVPSLNEKCVLELANIQD